VLTMPMPTNNRNADEQRFWDDTFQTAYRDALRRNHRRSDAARVTWAAARADGALEVRRRSQRGVQ
jgi:hypothetical protein